MARAIIAGGVSEWSILFLLSAVRTISPLFFGLPNRRSAPLHSLPIADCSCSEVPASLGRRKLPGRIGILENFDEFSGPFSILTNSYIFSNFGTGSTYDSWYRSAVVHPQLATSAVHLLLDLDIILGAFVPGALLVYLCRPSPTCALRPLRERLGSVYTTPPGSARFYVQGTLRYKEPEL